MQLCESPSHLTGGLRAQAEGNAKPRPRGPHKAPSDTATPGHESALPSVVRTLRKLLGGPGDPCSPCVGEHAAPTMVLLPPLAQGGASGLSPALSGHETQREDSPCRPAAVRVPLCAHALCATTSFSRGCSDGRMRPPRPEATRRGLTPPSPAGLSSSQRHSGHRVRPCFHRHASPHEDGSPAGAKPVACHT